MRCFSFTEVDTGGWGCGVVGVHPLRTDDVPSGPICSYEDNRGGFRGGGSAPLILAIVIVYVNISKIFTCKPLDKTRPAPPF